MRSRQAICRRAPLPERAALMVNLVRPVYRFVRHVVNDIGL